MEQYISRLRCGDVIDGRITHLEPFGAFVDIGCGIPSLMSIDTMSVSRIAHPSDRFSVGMDIKAVVLRREPQGRISLSHRELLGTWEENAALFHVGETVTGTVRSVEEYGVFVEIMPNLAGLAERRDGIEPGCGASVYIKSMIPERMKIKLVLVDTFRCDAPPPPLPTTSSPAPIWTALSIPLSPPKNASKPCSDRYFSYTQKKPPQ
jgi:small subunit ribosomal protein S1